jgi:hypothetical protein
VKTSSSYENIVGDARKKFVNNKRYQRKINEENVSELRSL